MSAMNNDAAILRYARNHATRHLTKHEEAFILSVLGRNSWMVIDQLEIPDSALHPREVAARDRKLAIVLHFLEDPLGRKDYILAEIESLREESNSK